MTPFLLDLLCDPSTGEPLRLEEAQYSADGRISEGQLVTPSGRRYPIVNGVPRFVGDTASVHSFGDQWNAFNFLEFRENWLTHTIRNTFGTDAVFRDKVVIDAGAGSGAQALWILQAGAAHVILLELSHSVDGVIQENLRPSGYSNWDVIQCSIDAPPLRRGSIHGIVMCHNVIQHTPSVRQTARALYSLVAPGSEFVFNCYPRNDEGLIRWTRFNLVYRPLRAVLSRMPFAVNYTYATFMGIARLVPGVGWLAEKSGFCVQGDVVRTAAGASRLKQRFRATRLNTFDCFGSHRYQHLLRDADLRAIVADLQPDQTRVRNLDRYFSRPAPIGCALRVFR